MKRKVFLIQMLVLLFTLQNIWNVAEAACLHEMPSFQNTRVLNKMSVPSSTKNLNKFQKINDSKQDFVENKKIYDYCQKVCFNEKCQHFANSVVIQLDTLADNQFKINIRLDIIQPYWEINFYQSPYLNFVTPPPELSPLVVG